MEVDYGQLRPLTPTGRHSIHFYYDVCPESPDGARIVYFMFDAAAPGPGSVVVAERDGSHPRAIAHVDSALPHSAVRQLWVDNHTVAYCPGEEGRLCTVLTNVDTGGVRAIHGALRMVHPSRPTGLTTLHDFQALEKMTDDTVCRMDLVSGELTPLFTVMDAMGCHPRGTDFPGSERVMFMHTKWSPSGRRFFVMASNVHRITKGEDLQPVHAIFVAEADGSDIRYLGEEYHHPIWSSDDDHVLSFRPGKGDGGLGMGWWGGYQDLLALPVGGGAGTPVFRSLAGKHLCPSPDGSRMVADATGVPARGEGSIFIYPIDGRAPQRVVVVRQDDFSQRGCHLHPTWSRDGRTIYFNSSEGGWRRLYGVHLPT